MTPEYFDIHAHTHFPAFKEDRDEVIKRALDNNTWLINIGTQKETSKEAVVLAHKYPKGVYASIGLHPIHTGASYHDQEELGSPDSALATDGKRNEQGFVSRGEIFDKKYP